MRKTITLATILLAFSVINAQQKPKPTAEPVVQNSFEDKARLGFIAGGLNFNHLDYYDKTTTIECANTSFHAGVLYQKSVSKYFAIQPAFLLSMRGGKIRDIDSTIEVHLLNIELPVNFIYTNKGLMAGGGPSFHYGIKGKINVNDQEGNAYDKTESMHLALKRFEFGANFMIGYKFKKGIFLTANFSPGLSNVYKGDGSAPSNIKAHTRLFGVSIGYMFGILKNYQRQLFNHIDTIEI